LAFNFKPQARSIRAPERHFKAVFAVIAA